MTTEANVYGDAMELFKNHKLESLEMTLLADVNDEDVLVSISMDKNWEEEVEEDCDDLEDCCVEEE